MKKTILFIVHTEWTDKLGLPKVSKGLFEHLSEIGWNCDYFSLNKRYFRNSILNRIFSEFFFQRDVLMYINSFGHKYNVIQIENNLLRYTKDLYKYSGKLISKSVGLWPIYKEFLEKYKKYPFGKLHHRLIDYMTLSASGGTKTIINGFKICDQIHLMSEYEANYVTNLGFGEKTYVIHNGLSQIEQNQLFEFYNVEKKYTSNLIVSIGSWTSRKGSDEWPHLVRMLRSSDPSLTFRFLGTGFSSSVVKSNFYEVDRPFVEVIPEYNNSELGIHLSDSRVGLFLTYVEGLPLGVLEMLASGTPVVSWNVPGPMEIFKTDLGNLLSEPGDLNATVQTVRDIFRLDYISYKSLSQDSRKLGLQFDWKSSAQSMDKILSN